jgi:hypothetical protein
MARDGSAVFTGSARRDTVGAAGEMGRRLKHRLDAALIEGAFLRPVVA